MEEATDETVTYQFSMGRETWRDWSNTVPRQTSLESRITTLIEQDLRAAQRDASSTDTSAKTVSLMSSRVRIRAINALGELRDDGDEDTEDAIKHLEEIIDIADAMDQ